LESFQNFNVGGGSSAPELYTVGPDGFEYGFIEYKFVGGGELGLSSEQPTHLNSEIKMYTQIELYAAEPLVPGPSHLGVETTNSKLK
jgi:hypothetical protein